MGIKDIFFNELSYSPILHSNAFTAILNNLATLIPFYYQTGLKTLPMRF